MALSDEPDPANTGVAPAQAQGVAMTTGEPTPQQRESAELARPPILTAPLLIRLVSVVASTVGFFLPLSVVPLFAARESPASLATARHSRSVCSSWGRRLCCS